jgi:hypothetical protein
LDVADVFLLLAVIFKLDELLELRDRGIVDFHAGRLPVRPAKDKTRSNEIRSPTQLPRSGSVQQNARANRRYRDIFRPGVFGFVDAAVWRWLSFESIGTNSI